VADYLHGVRHAEVVDLRTTDSGDVQPVYAVSGTHAPAVAPTGTTIWTAQATGSGTVSVAWKPAAGDWTVVLMNADGSSGVAADVSVGATLPWLGWCAGVLLGIAALGMALSVVLLMVALRARRR
jgi:hypothetical protein